MTLLELFLQRDQEQYDRRVGLPFEGGLQDLCQGRVAVGKVTRLVLLTLQLEHSAQEEQTLVDRLALLGPLGLLVQLQLLTASQVDKGVAGVEESAALLVLVGSQVDLEERVRPRTAVVQHRLGEVSV